MIALSCPQCGDAMTVTPSGANHCVRCGDTFQLERRIRWDRL